MCHYYFETNRILFPVGSSFWVQTRIYLQTYFTTKIDNDDFAST